MYVCLLSTYTTGGKVYASSWGEKPPSRGPWLRRFARAIERPTKVTVEATKSRAFIHNPLKGKLLDVFVPHHLAGDNLDDYGTTTLKIAADPLRFPLCGGSPGKADMEALLLIHKESSAK